MAPAGHENLYAAFGDAIFERRRALGMRQMELAWHVGLSRPAIANIETGRQGILLHKALEIASALDIPILELLSGHLPSSPRDMIRTATVRVDPWPPLLPESEGKDGR